MRCSQKRCGELRLTLAPKLKIAADGTGHGQEQEKWEVAERKIQIQLDDWMAGGLKVWKAQGLKTSKLLLPPRLSSGAGASRSLRHKGTVVARLERRKELKGSKKMTGNSRGKEKMEMRWRSARGVEEWKKRPRIQRNEALSFVTPVPLPASPKSQTRQLSKSRSALYYEVDPDLDSLKGFRLIKVNFLIEPAFRSSPHAYYYRDTGAIAVSLVVW